MSYGTIHLNGVCISLGNNKMGLIPSVSVPPVVTCPRGCPCARDCYAVGMCNRRPSVKNSYINNYSVFKADPAAYFQAVAVAASCFHFFRWHVAGDIPNARYFAGMLETARRCPGTVFLAFTKQYFTVNDYLGRGGVIPDNLIIIFSHWDDKKWPVPNPYNLPVCDVIFPGDVIPNGAHVCGGDCSACARTRTGCYGARPGSVIAIHFHK